MIGRSGAGRPRRRPGVYVGMVLLAAAGFLAGFGRARPSAETARGELRCRSPIAEVLDDRSEHSALPPGEAIARDEACEGPSRRWLALSGVVGVAGLAILWWFRRDVADELI